MVFKYLRRVLTASYYDWPSVVGNLRKARSTWDRFSRILGWEGADPHTSVTFYMALVQEKLLFGLDTWVVTPRIGRTLGRSHHRLARRLEVMQPIQDMDGRWKYPHLEPVMEGLGP